MFTRFAPTWTVAGAAARMPLSTPFALTISGGFESGVAANAALATSRIVRTVRRAMSPLAFGRGVLAHGPARTQRAARSDHFRFAQASDVFPRVAEHLGQDLFRVLPELRRRPAELTGRLAQPHRDADD